MQYRNIRLGATGNVDERDAFNTDVVLTEEEIRILGCLVEKEATTPDYYPLTMNAVLAACNQKSSRDPIVSYDEDTVRDTLASLQETNLVHRIISSEGGRVQRFRHMFSETFALIPEHAAVLCVLMLRGPQTPGEIRQRTGRIFPFESLAEIEEALDALADRSKRPLVVKLARRPGTKEWRYAHLLGGAASEQTEETSFSAPSPAATPGLSQRVEILEQQVADLRRALDQLRADLGADS